MLNTFVLVSVLPLLLNNSIILSVSLGCFSQNALEITDTLIHLYDQFEIKVNIYELQNTLWQQFLADIHT